MATVFVDTNVWLYAIGADHPLKAPCRAVLERIRDGALSANTNTEVVQELLYVLTRRGRKEEALRLARNVIELFPALLPVTRADMRRASDLLERTPELSARDAVHAATMLADGLEVIITADAGFDAVESIERVDPTVVQAPEANEDAED